MKSRFGCASWRYGRIVAACAMVALAPTAAHSDSKPSGDQGILLTAGNDFLQIHIQSTPGSGVGEFTVTNASGANVLFGNGRPGSSYTTVHSYTTNTDYVQGTGKPGFSIDAFGLVKPLGSAGFEVTYRLPGAPVTPDKLTIVQDIVVTGDAAAESKVRETTTVVETGDTAERVGVRHLWDYDIAGDDAPALDLAGGATSSTEKTLAAPSATVIGSTGTSASTGAGIAPAVALGPDSVRYVSWKPAFGTAFDYTVTPGLTADKDSAVLTYFGSTPGGAIVVEPGNGKMMTASLSTNAEKEDKVTITVKPKVAAVGQEITITAKEAGPPDGDKVSWKAPGGTPASGKGWTFTTKYATVGKKTIEVNGLADDGAPPSVTVEVVRVRFDIDGETDPKKSLCMLKNTVGVKEDGVVQSPLRLRTPCHVWVEGTPDAAVKVVLKNPDTKLLFTKALAATTKLTLPADGTKVGFLLYGEKASAAIGDAKVEAHLDDATDQLLGDQKVTVFFFEPTLTLAPDGLYSIIDNVYRPAIGHVGINMGASAKAKPDTVNVDAGVLRDIDISICQNLIKDRVSLLENKPQVKWGANVEAGTKVKVPSTITVETNNPNPSNDTDEADDPLYTQDFARPNAPAMATRDSPRDDGAKFDISVKDVDTGEIVGTAMYNLDSVTYDDHWRTWAVAYQKSSKAEFPLMENTWDLDFKSTDLAAKQKATTGAAAVAATNPPLRGAPFSNNLIKPTTTKGPNITVEQPGVESVTLAPASVKGGTGVKATIKLTAKAGFGGTQVNLGSDRPTIAKPHVANVRIPADDTSIVVDIDTFGVAADEHVRIAASCHDKAASARLTVTK